MVKFEISQQQRAFAKSQRRGMTALEERLWKALRNRRLQRWKFRRQVAIGPYVADFVCFEARLIVEADGPHHLREDQQAHDVERDAWFASNGFMVLRLSGDEIVGDLSMSIGKVESALAAKSPSDQGK